MHRSAPTPETNKYFGIRHLVKVSDAHMTSKQELHHHLQCLFNSLYTIAEFSDHTNHFVLLLLKMPFAPLHFFQTPLSI